MSSRAAQGLEQQSPPFLVEIELHGAPAPRTCDAKHGVWFDPHNEAHRRAREDVAVAVFAEVVAGRMSAAGALRAAAQTAGTASSHRRRRGASSSSLPSWGRPPTAAESAERWAASAAAAVRREAACFTPAAHTAAFIERELLRESFEDYTSSTSGSSGSSGLKASGRKARGEGERGAGGFALRMRRFLDMTTLKERVRAAESAGPKRGNSLLGASKASKCALVDGGADLQQRQRCALRRWMSEHGPLEGSSFEDGGERWVVVRCGVDAETKQRVAFYQPDKGQTEGHDDAR